MVNSPTSYDTLLVSDPERPGKKIGVSKLLFQISIREIHDYLVSESIIYLLKEEIDETTWEPLISDRDLHAIMTKNFQKMTGSFKILK